MFDAGSLEPCFERRSSAGAQFGSWGGWGVRYSDRRVWYIDGEESVEFEVGSRRLVDESEDSEWR